jgi:delta8-fatty-acid desaturase
VPRHNLRSGQALVRNFCEKIGVKYRCSGFAEGNRVVLGRLEEVAFMVKMTVDCRRDMADNRATGLH